MIVVEVVVEVVVLDKLVLLIMLHHDQVKEVMD